MTSVELLPGAKHYPKHDSFTLVRFHSHNQPFPIKAIIPHFPDEAATMFHVTQDQSQASSPGASGSHLLCKCPTLFDCTGLR